jgi:hypothetical protein
VEILYHEINVNRRRQPASSASLATTFGDNSLEEHINKMAVKQIHEYVMTLQSTNGELKNAETLNKLLTELQQTVIVL